MIRILLFLSLSFVYLQGVSAQDAGNELFQDTILHEIRFEFDQADFLDSLKYYYENSAFNPDGTGDIPYMMGSITIDSTTVDSVGVRFKGFTSYFGRSDKKPIKIDFNEFVKGKRYDGLRKLNLNNGFGDASIQRDFVCYDLHRSMGVAVPRTAYTKVYFNDEYWGLYIMIEQVDKEFLERNFANNNGNLFKNKGWSDLEWGGNTQTTYDTIFELKTNEEEDDWLGFIGLMDLINNSSNSDFQEQIESQFNVPLYLKVLAVDVATGNWDSYIEHGRNWYMYEDLETGIFHWIPWDYNFALGGVFPGFEVNSLIRLFNINQKNSEKVLIQRLLNIDEYYDMYLSYFCNMLDNKFLSSKYDTLIERNKLLIQEAFADDDMAFYTNLEFLKDIGQDRNSLRDRISTHLNLLNRHLDRIIDCPEIKGPLAWQSVSINELMAANDSLSQISDPQGDFDDWIELYNNSDEKIDLSNIYLSDDRQELKKWSFPLGTTIDTNTYLIVWADDDGDLDALHANFKLSKAGEELYLSNEDGTLVDSLVFFEQTLNLGYARIPNGTGSFIEQAPTFNENNEDLVNLWNANQVMNVDIFPNPTSELLNINWSSTQGEFIVQIYDLLGSLILSKDVKGQSTVLIDVNHLPKGSYIGSVLRNSDKSNEGNFKFSKI